MLYIVSKVLDYGPKVFNTLNSQTFELSTLDAVEQIKSKKIKIENAKVEKNELVATKGDWKRYSFVGCPQRPVVLYRLEDDREEVMGYRIYDTDEKMRDYTVEDTISLGLSVGIANAKISTNSKKTYITPIGGAFPVLTVRTKQEEVSKIVVEVSNKQSKIVGIVTVVNKQGKVSRHRIAATTTIDAQHTDGVVLGNVFNKFLKYKVYNILDGKSPSMGKKPDGIKIGKTVNFEEGLSFEDYVRVSNFIGCHLEKILEKVNYSIYEIKSIS